MWNDVCLVTKCRNILCHDTDFFVIQNVVSQYAEWCISLYGTLYFIVYGNYEMLYFITGNAVFNYINVLSRHPKCGTSQNQWIICAIVIMNTQYM